MFVSPIVLYALSFLLAVILLAFLITKYFLSRDIKNKDVITAFVLLVSMCLTLALGGYIDLK